MKEAQHIIQAELPPGFPDKARTILQEFWKLILFEEYEAHPALCRAAQAALNLATAMINSPGYFKTDNHIVTNNAWEIIQAFSLVNESFPPGFKFPETTREDLDKITAATTATESTSPQTVSLNEYFRSMDEYLAIPLRPRNPHFKGAVPIQGK